jgi:hypothetical protein
MVFPPSIVCYLGKKIKFDHTKTEPMNKYVLTLVCTIALAFQLNAQKIEADQVPAPVKNSFSSVFKGSMTPSWELKDGNYVATFVSGGVESAGLFHANGKFIQYEWNIKNAELPEATKSYMSNKSILGSKRIKNGAGSISYEVSTADSKYIFDDKGTFVSSK